MGDYTLTMPTESTRTVWMSLLSGLGVVLAKVGAAVVYQLVRVSLRLVRRNHDFHLSQPIPAFDWDRSPDLSHRLPGRNSDSRTNFLLSIYRSKLVWVLARRRRWTRNRL